MTLPMTPFGIASGAEITALPSFNDVRIISIKGNIVRGDARDFISVAEAKMKTLVILSSPGGSVNDALEIGAEIRLNGYATTVADECASACGLIWLSGVRRYLNESAKVGFHAAYFVRDGIAQETGMGNADIGSFLTHLGLRREAIQFITAASPNEIRWLTREDAKRLGIALEPLQKVQNAGPPPASQKPAYVTRPAEPDETKNQIVQMAFFASQLVIALECKKAFRVDETKVRSMHAQLMKDSERFGDRFIDVLGAELKARAQEVKRDGLERFCTDQRNNFRNAGIGVYP